MDTDNAQMRPLYFDTRRACIVEDCPSCLALAEWAQRYGAVLRPHTFQWRGQRVMSLCYVVASTHPRILEAKAHAEQLALLLSQGYNWGRHRSASLLLRKAGYTVTDLVAPTRLVCYHLALVNYGVCLGFLHTARHRDIQWSERLFYVCDRCSWFTPTLAGVCREDLLMERSTLLMPIDTAYVLPFINPEQEADPTAWTRRIFLEHGVLVAEAAAAKMLTLSIGALRDLCQVRQIQTFEHPDLAGMQVLFLLDVEAELHRRGQVSQSKPEEMRKSQEPE